MRIITIPIGGTSANCYIADCENGFCAVIDPGFDGRRIFSETERQGVRPCAILFTHMHFDHIMGTNALQELLPSPVPMYIHADDRVGLLESSLNLSGMAYGRDYAVAGEVTTLTDSEEIILGGTAFKVLHTPGHTPGSVCYSVESEGIVFSGDTLFHGTIGRTDFPGGDRGEMKKSLAKLSELDDKTVLYPGHGDATTIGEEKRSNPYMSGDYAEYGY